MLAAFPARHFTPLGLKLLGDSPLEPPACILNRRMRNRTCGGAGVLRGYPVTLLDVDVSLGHRYEIAENGKIAGNRVGDARTRSGVKDI